MTLELSVVVPVYNEADNLEPLHAEISQVLSLLGRRYEVVYVDDGSTDRSFAVLSELQRRDPHVVVVRLPRNYGQTAALAAGFDQSSGAARVDPAAAGPGSPPQ